MFWRGELWKIPSNNRKILVDSILRANEYTHEFSSGSIKSYESNQLASNNPIEDCRSEATCLQSKGFLVGVFDGHGGGACAQVIAKRLYYYITACLMPQEALTRTIDRGTTPNLIESFNDKVQFVDDVRDLYSKSFWQFILDLAAKGNNQFEIPYVLEKAFLRLDEDLSREAVPDPSQVDVINIKTMSVAMSGSVACVAHIDGPHLHLANVGDCAAVLGTLTDTDTWVASKLTTEHNTFNQAEVDRIMKEHPMNENTTVIKMDRLLSQLAPLRALGDFRFKWSKEIMNNIVAKHFGSNVIPPNYHTPPYLSAKPDITHHRLTPRDKFLIIATDGLWDVISPLQAVRLVGEHMKGKVTLSPMKLPKKKMTLNEINEMLLHRKEGLLMKPKDSNAATHIIRNALGGTEFGVDHARISQMLTLPEDMVRLFRDDITVTIVYFDSEYLRLCP
ncbi:pyruvate dehydrogenase [acetyl-transferring]-phosphatase 1, mitochondrial isoform X2 [Aethina tumida]|uniref:pyruvate dehydrogenase [acetyl-transferring]-phosphatase 1, mitochondrial isoform X2 n=1 Tax=Aethina tumida TaxID=116153 RepID=UPI002147CD98|nr:pyruvate dehydrogenase [acetyl-transferring]-phosphatase 1, mitochondrial isoform X2 [Aethina tumida]